MVEIFKTNVKYKRQAKMLLCHLLEKFPSFKINFDLDDCDKILRIEGENICHQEIAESLAKTGYRCEVLN